MLILCVHLARPNGVLNNTWKVMLVENKMTEGSAYKFLLSLTGPVLMGQILQQLYNIGDTAIIGRFVGVDALAAVGASWSVNYIVSFFCIGSCMGISVPLSQSYGANDNRSLRRYFFNGIYFCIVMAVVMTLIATCGCKWFLSWLHTPSRILHDAGVYFFIVMCGLPFIILYNFCYGVLMAFGDSKRASIYMAISTILNLVCDLLFVIVFRLGVGGAALATTLSQFVAAVLSLLYILKRYPILYTDDKGRRLRIIDAIHCASHDAAISSVYLGNIVRMCMPMGVQYSITAVGALILQKSMNGLGEAVIAAYSSGQKVKSLLVCPLSALGTSLASYVGQNYGAGKYDRIDLGVRKSLVLGSIYSAALVLLMLFVRKPLAYVFVSGDEVATINYICTFIMYSAVFDFLIVILFTYRYAVQGMGFGRYSIFSAIAEMLGRALTAVFLVPLWGFTAIALSEGITFIAGIVVIVPLYFHIRKMCQGTCPR